jgi:hypothetical protein
MRACYAACLLSLIAASTAFSQAPLRVVYRVVYYDPSSGKASGVGAIIRDRDDDSKITSAGMDGVVGDPTVFKTNRHIKIVATQPMTFVWVPIDCPKIRPGPHVIILHHIGEEEIQFLMRSIDDDDSQKPIITPSKALAFSKFEDVAQ